jgi:hypothetical protein
MSNLRRSFALITVTLFTSSADSGETQKWCQSAELISTNKKASWFSAHDLPSDGPLFKHRKFDGNGTYQIFVIANGRVKNCIVTRSSGEATLDATGCSILKRRARFNSLEKPECSDVVRATTYTIRYSWDDTYKGPEEAGPHLLTGVL